MTRIPIAVELRFLRIRTKWTLHTHVVSDQPSSRGKDFFEDREEVYFAPQVPPDSEHRMEVIANEDPWELRNQFLRMKHTESAALEFLCKIGVWQAVEGRKPQPNMPRTGMYGAFGHRVFSGIALPVALDDLWREQAEWKALLRSPTTLAARFGPPPGDNVRPYIKTDFAYGTHFGNTLPIHMESGKHPRAIVQPITGRELLIATAWVDLVRGSKVQVCQRPDCGIPFTGRKQKYCDWYCGHIVSVRKSRNPEQAEEPPKAGKNRKRKLKRA